MHAQVIFSQLTAKLTEYAIPKISMLLRACTEEKAMIKAGFSRPRPMTFYEEQVRSPAFPRLLPSFSDLP